ncbi:hypothetical protein KR018_003226 [Drosophila ironensis]|nr:hypothetical protein KR018_003226 [Drosophila ironensis]
MEPQKEYDLGKALAAWFNHLAGAGAGAGEHASAEDALRRRLQEDADVERDGSGSSFSESVGGSTGGAIRPTSSGSPKEGMVGGHDPGRARLGHPVQRPAPASVRARLRGGCSASSRTSYRRTALRQRRRTTITSSSSTTTTTSKCTTKHS